MEIEKSKLKLSGKQKLMIVSVICFLVALIGTAYAWVAYAVLGDAASMNITSAYIAITYRGTSDNVQTDLAPGESIIKTFSIINNSATNSATFSLIWTIVENTFVNKNYLMYTLEDDVVGQLVSARYLPSIDGPILYDVVILPQEERNYTLTITYVSDPVNNQIHNQDKYFVGDVWIGIKEYVQNDIITTYVVDELVTEDLTLSNYTIDTFLTYCTDGASISIVGNEFELINRTNSTFCEVYLIPKQADFSYTPTAQIYPVMANGLYTLEVWGAQGGSYSGSLIGGYGAYSKGDMFLTRGENLYTYVGGSGLTVTSGTTYYAAGGYNGGGTGGNNSGAYSQGGGGSTDIRLFGETPPESSDLLWNSTLGLNSRIIIAGGGGGITSTSNYIPGHGGGYIGGLGTASSGTYSTPAYYANGGTQTSGGVNAYNSLKNGLYGMALQSTVGAAGGGGGGGYYGGAQGYGTGGGGGSGYIGNENLINKYMCCFNCTISDDENTKTITTTQYSSNPIENYAKSGNGHARISYNFMRNIIYENPMNLLIIDLDGGFSETNTSPKYYYPEDIINVIPPVRNIGETFVRWEVTGGDGFSNGNNIIMGSTYTYAKAIYTDEYQLSTTYSCADDETSGALSTGLPTTMKYNTTVTLPTPSKSKYQFVRWDLVSGAGSSINGNILTMGIEPVIINAVFNRIEWTKVTKTCISNLVSYSRTYKECVRTIANYTKNSKKCDRDVYNWNQTTRTCVVIDGTTTPPIYGFSDSTSTVPSCSKTPGFTCNSSHYYQNYVSSCSVKNYSYYFGVPSITTESSCSDNLISCSSSTYNTYYVSCDTNYSYNFSSSQNDVVSSCTINSFACNSSNWTEGRQQTDTCTQNVTYGFNSSQQSSSTCIKGTSFTCNSGTLGNTYVSDCN